MQDSSHHTYEHIVHCFSLYVLYFCYDIVWYPVWCRWDQRPSADLCLPGHTADPRTSCPPGWKLHFSSINEDLLLYWLMVHFSSEGLKSMNTTWRLNTEAWWLMSVMPTLHRSSPHSSLINKWRSQCISWDIACFCQRKIAFLPFHLSIPLNHKPNRKVSIKTLEIIYYAVLSQRLVKETFHYRVCVCRVICVLVLKPILKPSETGTPHADYSWADGHIIALHLLFEGF